MKLHRIQAGHYTCETQARIRWPDSDGETLVPVLVRVWFEDEWTLPAWALTIVSIDHRLELVETGDVHSDTLRDMRATVTRMLTGGWWEYSFGLGWCWVEEKEERKKLIHVLANACETE